MAEIDLFVKAFSYVVDVLWFMPLRLPNTYYFSMPKYRLLFVAFVLSSSIL